jgi:glycerate 2-kinase
MTPAHDTHGPLADGTPLAEAAAEAFLAGVAAADPTVIVRKAVRQGLLDDWFGSRERPRMIHVLAVGKAAPRMLWGLVEASVPFRGLGVAIKGVAAPNVDTFRWLPGNHPLPGKESFAAGAAVLDFVAGLPRDEPLLVLMSGGASSAMEVPLDVGAFELQRQWTEWLAAGIPIEDVNVRRSRMSKLKGGKLGAAALQRTAKVRVWVLADTDPTTAPWAVGSGPFFQSDPTLIPHRVLASNDDAVTAAGLRLGSLGFNVFRHASRVSGDVQAEVKGFIEAFHMLPEGRVALVGGGEPTVRHPVDAPKGGRCQQAAVLAALELGRRKSQALFFAAGTDGVDGTTDAAGAWATAADGGGAAERAVKQFAAHDHLAQRKRLLHTGPTGTNVNDLWICLRNG